MTLGVLGIVAGCLAGALIGAAVFGPIGAAGGLLIGAAIGGVTMRFFSAAAAQEEAHRPYKVVCPDCNEPVQVYLDPKEARDAVVLGGPQRVRGCDRWRGEVGCERQCEKQIVL